METKVCIECGKEKNINEFDFRNDTQKYRNQCRDCRKKQNKKYHMLHREEYIKKSKDYYAKHKESQSIKMKEYREEHKDELKEMNKKWRENNKDYIKAKYSEYRQNNREKLNEYSKKYYENNKAVWKEYYAEYNQVNAEKIKTQQKEWRDSHKEYRNEYAKEYNKTRKETDEIFYFKVRVRDLIIKSFKRKKLYKKETTESILGCNLDFFHDYLLKTFESNYGYKWDGIEDVHIDHIIPLATATTEEEIIKLCHYTNLQLLKAKDNLEKNDNLDWKINN